MKLLISALLALALVAAAAIAQSVAQTREKLDLTQVLFLFAHDAEEQIKQLRSDLERREREWHEYVAPLLNAAPSNLSEK